ncbi:MAG: hypothetical protein J0J05_04500 [Microbacterium sp.]|uniref:hypothetical protein n=1 Tax=Microbacterium sp. TaxID=51671 RepID=UPI001AC86A63|nr:hypothetical protein [Microbacterium sp.]MBN9153228.1 hypothetical protein [Microbacterium sp.]
MYVTCGTADTALDWFVFGRASSVCVELGYANRVVEVPGDPAVVFACDTDSTRPVPESYPIVTTAPVGPVIVVNDCPVYPNEVVFPSASTIEVRFDDESFTHFTNRKDDPDVCDAVSVYVDDEYDRVAVRAAVGPAALTTLFGFPVPA